MAVILGQITINNTQLLEVDSDPSIGGGTVAEIGDLAIDTNTGLIYTKRSATNTDWKNLSFDNFTQEVSASGNITTTSTTDVLATGMTITPPAGTYMVFFQSSMSHGSNGGSVFVSTYAGGTLVPNSQIQSTRGNQTHVVPVTIAGVLATVNGAQAIEARWRVTAGTGTLTGFRRMSILRVA